MLPSNHRTLCNSARSDCS